MPAKQLTAKEPLLNSILHRYIVVTITNEHDLAHVKYLNVLYYNRTQK